MKDAPKIGVIFGAVVDSASGEPVPYASISVINERGGTIVTGGITKENGEFHIKEIPLGRHSIVVEYIGYAPKKIGPLTFIPEFRLDSASEDVFLDSYDGTPTYTGSLGSFLLAAVYSF